MRILFEDNENSPVSVLLRNSCMGDIIEFSNGVARLCALASEYLNEDLLLVFIDLVPNNKATWYYYADLLDLQVKARNMYVCPIFCIEFYVLLMLQRDGYIQEAALTDGLFGDLVKEELLRSKTLEKRFKLELSRLGSLSFCLLNSRSLTNSTTRGYFYEKDCPCGGFCRLNSRNHSLSEKANALYTCLPVLLLPAHKRDNIASNLYTLVSWEDAFQAQVKLYEKYCAALDMSNILVQSDVMCLI